jgi:hypothetical protein
VLAALAVAATVFTGCEHRTRTRPAQIVVTCADANFYVGGLKWTRWTESAAAATGTAHVNDCKPYCAAGHFHTYPLVVRLSKPVTCVKHRREFSRIAWRYPGAKPAGLRSDAETLPCTLLRQHA